MKLHCRIGSLEKEKNALVPKVKLHCRIGSLEMSGVALLYIALSSLPNRQLRNGHHYEHEIHYASLPNRQLRKINVLNSLE